MIAAAPVLLLTHPAGLAHVGAFNAWYFLGVDGISMPLIVLTAFITPLVVTAGWTVIQGLPAGAWHAWQATVESRPAFSATSRRCSVCVNRRLLPSGAGAVQLTRRSMVPS